MRSKIFLFLLLLPFSLLAQEFDCFNQIDDDGDGLIDMLDPDCSCFLFNEVGDSQLTTTPPAGNTGQYCFDITDAVNSQLGAIWLQNKIDLSNDFAFRAEIYAGNNDGGADGFAIVFHNDPSGTAASGLDGVNLGFGGYDNWWGAYDPSLAITPSIAFEIDTFDNGVSQGDVSPDHIAISINGDVTNPISTPATTALPNIEDGLYHDVLIEWNSTSQTFFFEIDGIYNTSYSADVVNTVFSGQNLINFGFTGSTGGFNNRQTICITGLDLPSAGTSGTLQICNEVPQTFNLFDQLGGVPSDIGTWEDPLGNPFGSSYLGAYDATTDVLGVYTYTVQNNSGCNAPFATIDVTTSTTTYTLDSTNNTACDSGDGSLIFSSLLPNATYDLIYDLNGNTISSLISFTSDNNGEYLLGGLVNGDYTNILLSYQGCVAASSSVKIYNVCDIPSGFSPNNDGINDSFDIAWLEALNIQIYNRYGTEVYKKANYRDEWYGVSDAGKELSVGTYYYVIEVAQRSPITGWVYINREN